MLERLLIGIIGVMLSAGCQIVDPPEFETYEMDFRDSLTSPASVTELVVVLE